MGLLCHPNFSVTYSRLNNQYCIAFALQAQPSVTAILVRFFLPLVSVLRFKRLC